MCGNEWRCLRMCGDGDGWRCLRMWGDGVVMFKDVW